MKRPAWRTGVVGSTFQKEFDEAPINEGHKAIASILRSQSGLGLITQNIDGLHQRSGIDDNLIIEIHGNGVSASCLECSSPMSLTRGAKPHYENR